MTVWISPTQIATFKGCHRKWAYRYIDGIKPPPKPTQEFGIEGHKRNELYLRKGQHVGDDDVGKVCQQGIKPGYMPTPAPDLLIESKLTIPILGGAATMIGYIDCILPPRQAGSTVTVPVAHDWKFTKDLRWAMTPAELAEDSQAAVYTRWLQLKYKVQKVVARWVYFCGRINAKSEDGRPRTPRGVKKSELTFTAAEIEANWQREIEVAKQIVETKAKFAKAADVPPNETHCDAYGGCDYREMCPIGDGFGLGAMLEQWDRTHNGNWNKEQDKMSADDVMAVLKAHKANMLAHAKAPPAEEKEPRQKVTETTPPPVEPQQDSTPAAGIELVAKLQAQSGQAELPAEPPPTAEEPDLLSKLQAQTGATGVNPPEAQAAEPKVVVAKTEPPPVEPLTNGAAADGLATHTKAEPAAETPPFVAEWGEDIPAEVGKVVETVPDKPLETVKPTKGKPKTSKVNTSKATKAPFVLCIDAIPAKLHNGTLGEVVHLSEFLEPYTTAIQKGHRCEEHPQGVDHWALIEFNNGPGILAHHVATQLDKKGFSGVLVVDGDTPEARAVKEVLIRRADVVFRGVR